MKRTVLFGWCIGTAFFLSLGGMRVGDARKICNSTTSRVSIDGRSFTSEAFPGHPAHFLRLELERLGVELPEGWEPEVAAVPGHPAFNGGLMGSTTHQPPTNTPAGLTAEHALRIEGEGQSIELAFGRIDLHGFAVRARLQADGWTPDLQENNAGNPRVLQKIRGKETAVACLDETERTFLLIRKVDR
jgi:hypothetical protein